MLLKLSDQEESSKLANNHWLALSIKNTITLINSICDIIEWITIQTFPFFWFSSTKPIAIEFDIHLVKFPGRCGRADHIIASLILIQNIISCKRWGFPSQLSSNIYVDDRIGNWDLYNDIQGSWGWSCFKFSNTLTYFNSKFRRKEKQRKKSPSFIQTS